MRNAGGRKRHSAANRRAGSSFTANRCAANRRSDGSLNEASRSRHAYEPSGSGSGRNYILAAYILFGLGAIIQFMPIVGVILAYMKRNSLDSIVYAAHTEYLIKTFWRTFWLYLLGALTARFGIGVLIIIATTVWYFYRIIAGFIRFNDGRAVAPEKWI